MDSMLSIKEFLAQPEDQVEAKATQLQGEFGW
jgi:hypothetical protein